MNCAWNVTLHSVNERLFEITSPQSHNLFFFQNVPVWLVLGLFLFFSWSSYSANMLTYVQLTDQFQLAWMLGNFWTNINSIYYFFEIVINVCLDIIIFWSFEKAKLQNEISNLKALTKKEMHCQSVWTSPSILAFRQHARKRSRKFLNNRRCCASATRLRAMPNLPCVIACSRYCRNCFFFWWWRDTSCDDARGLRTKRHCHSCYPL